MHSQTATSCDVIWFHFNKNNLNYPAICLKNKYCGGGVPPLRSTATRDEDDSNFEPADWLAGRCDEDDIEWHVVCANSNCECALPSWLTIDVWLRLIPINSSVRDFDLLASCSVSTLRLVTDLQTISKYFILINGSNYNSVLQFPYISLHRTDDSLVMIYYIIIFMSFNLQNKDFHE